MISSAAATICSLVVESLGFVARARGRRTRQRTSTGYARPSTSTTGAPSKCSAKRAVSIVAEVTMSFRSRPLRQQALQIAEQEIDVEAALVRLVEDDRVVRARATDRDCVSASRMPSVMNLISDALRHLIGEAHLEADEIADLRAELARDATRDRARGDAARLRAADHAGLAAAGGQAEFRQLRGLARAGLAGEHDDLMLADQLDDLVGRAR